MKDSVPDHVGKPSLRVVIAVGAGIDNHGNDASLEAMLLSLSRIRPNASITCVCHNPELVERRFGLPSAPLRWMKRRQLYSKVVDRLSLRLWSQLYSWYKTYRFLHNKDLLLFSGTGLLDDFNDSPFGMPYSAFMWSACARIRGLKVAMVSIGAGPIHNPLSGFLMVNSARLANYRSYRDYRSRSFLKSKGVRTRDDKVFPDLVFGLPISTIPFSAHERNLVGIGLMYYRGWNHTSSCGGRIYDTYLENMVGLFESLKSKGYKVVFIAARGEERILSDLRKTIKKNLPELYIRDYQERITDSFQEQAEFIAQTRVMIAARYHTVIASLRQNVPVLALGYDLKFLELMDSMDLGRYYKDLETCDLPSLLSLVDELIGQSSSISHTIEQKNIDAKSQLLEQEALLEGSLPGR